MKAHIRRMLLIIIPLGIGLLTAAGFPILLAWAQEATFTPSPTVTLTPTATNSIGYYLQEVPGSLTLIAPACAGYNGYITVPNTYLRETYYGIIIDVERTNYTDEVNHWGFGPSTPNKMNGGEYGQFPPGNNLCFDRDNTSPYGGTCTNLGLTKISNSGYSPFTENTSGSISLGAQTNCSHGTSTWTFHNLRIIRYGIQPTPTPIITPTQNPACPGIIYDGGMEEYPSSSYWHLKDTTRTDEKFYRLNNQNLVHKIFEGPPYCGEGWHKTGTYNELFQEKRAGDILQSFCWPGGDFYWQAAVRPNKDGVRPVINVFNNYEFGDPSLVRITLLDDLIFNKDDWTIYNGQEILPSGQYSLTLGEWYDHDSSVYWDNIEISNNPILPGICATNIVPTGTVVPQMTPTLCSPAAINLDNCGFDEYDEPKGEHGWLLDDPSMIYDHPIYGKILMVSKEDMYGGENGGAWSYQFDYRSCGEGGLYVNFKVKGVYELHLGNNAGQKYITGSIVFGDEFQTRTHKFNVPNGTYQIGFYNLSDHEALWIDDVGVGTGGIGYCMSEQHTATPGPTVTRTASQTKTITVTGTRPTGTPTRTPSVSPSSTIYSTPTLVPTWSPTPKTPTRTAISTWTMAPPAQSSTPIPTDTPQPSDTVGAGTPTPTERPTYTPYATHSPMPSITPSPIVPDWPTPTYVPPFPPQQPPPSCYAACIRPSPPTWDIDLGEGIWNQFLTLIRMTNIFNLLKQIAGFSIDYVGGWIEFARCYSLSFIVWCPEHTQAIIHLTDGFATVEPFGTINEVKTGFDTIATAYNAYNWADTGVKINGTPIVSGNPPNFDDWKVPSNSPYNGGPIDITGGGITYAKGTSSTECTFGLEPWVGPMLSDGMCFAFTTLDRLGVLYWFQLLIDLISIIILVTYIFKRWINAGMD